MSDKHPTCSPCDLCLVCRVCYMGLKEKVAEQTATVKALKKMLTTFIDRRYNASDEEMGEWERKANELLKEVVK